MLAYVVNTSTEGEAEGGVAMAYLAEFVYWLACLLVVGVGFIGVVFLGIPTT